MCYTIQEEFNYSQRTASYVIGVMLKIILFLSGPENIWFTILWFISDLTRFGWIFLVEEFRKLWMIRENTQFSSKHPWFTFGTLHFHIVVHRKLKVGSPSQEIVSLAVRDLRTFHSRPPAKLLFCVDMLSTVASVSNRGWTEGKTDCCDVEEDSCLLHFAKEGAPVFSLITSVLFGVNGKIEQ